MSGESREGGVTALRALSILWPTGCRVDCSGACRLGGRVADGAEARWDHRDAWDRPSARDRGRANVGTDPRSRGTCEDAQLRDTDPKGQAR